MSRRQLPAARLVPKDRADQAVVARDAVKHGLVRGALLAWALLKLAVIGVLLVAAVGLALHFLQRWGEPKDPLEEWIQDQQRRGNSAWVVQ